MKFNLKRRKRKGNVVVMIAVLAPVLVGLGAFAIDVGYIAYARGCLQAGADGAALAAVEELPANQTTLNAVAARYAALNDLPGGNVQVTVEGGTWDEDTATFTVTSLSAARAVRVSLQRPATMNFAALLGVSSASISASAVATKAGLGGRFLIDDEMIGPDVPSIQTLAANTGKTTTELLTARGLNQGKQYGASDWTWTDNFIDMPAGATLSLPTGQGASSGSSDPGMFDIDHPDFPFQDDSSFMEFLMYSESGNDPAMWGTEFSHVTSQLDPLPGVSPVDNASSYESYVDPEFVHVSPVFASDMSTLNPQNGIPSINGAGLRRGLIAFKIKAVGSDVDGGGSFLPGLVVEIVDPATIDPADVRHSSRVVSKFRLVQ